MNSTAMLVEFHRRGIQPNLILFADTGGERPETYAAVQKVSDWCKAHGMPEILTVKATGKTLEQDCLDRKALPSIAYGANKTCSQRWKMAPQDREINARFQEGRIIKAIGFDAGESRRSKAAPDGSRFENWFPLIEWAIFREDCVEICQSEGLPTAKSSCFFCPSMKRREIIELAKMHPELAKRAIEMENNAQLTTVKGLGRDFAWGDFLANEADQMRLWPEYEVPEIPCGCYDG